MRTWKTFPGAVVVSGDHDFLRMREINTAISSAKKSGRRVVHLSAGDSVGLQEVCSGSFLFSSETLVVVESVATSKRGTKSEEEDSWSDEDVELVVGNAEHKGGVSILIHHARVVNPKTFAGKVVARIPKNGHLVFVAPKAWEAKEAATRFLQAEVSRRGKTISESLAEAVVTLVGPDLGPLFFEAQKVCLLLDARGRTEVQQADLTGLVASFGTGDWGPLKEALGARNMKATLRALTELQGGPAGDSVMATCVILAREVTKWTHAASLLEAGLGKEEIAARMQMKPFVLEKFVLPKAQRWGKAALVDLLRGIVGVQAGVKKGHQDPWTELEAVLVLGLVG